MNRSSWCVIAVISLLPPPAIASEPTAHVHGVASLQVVIDGKILTLSLESPLDNLVGFEYAPRTDKQIAAVRAMAERLHQPTDLLTPSFASPTLIGRRHWPMLSAPMCCTSDSIATHSGCVPYLTGSDRIITGASVKPNTPPT